MTTRAPFLTSPYGGYFHSEVPAEDEELTHVGPGTPCGEYMRRFWHPVVLSEELKDVSVPIRILGEDLVAFRDGRGEIGVLELHCSHRGTSLEFGLICDVGIRCCYHFWRYDVDGKILETPGEPADSTYKDRFYHGAYPTREHDGLVFAYMGPPEKQPEFPSYDMDNWPGYRTISNTRFNFPCNWLQVKENAMDPAHLEFLHAIPGVNHAQFPVEYGLKSEIDWHETPIGMLYTATRRFDDLVSVRVSDFIPPNIHQFPFGEGGNREVSVRRPRNMNFAVPVDDTNTMFMGFMRYDGDQVPQRGGGSGEADFNRPYEVRQRVPGDYEAQVAQRPIARHGLEHLATTDRGVIMMRDIIRRGIRAVQSGEDPQGVQRKAGEVIATYSNQTVLHLPAASTQEADRQLLRDTAKSVSERYINDPSALARETS